MIKVAITGADHPTAGELIRILVNHPDVEIVAIVAPGHEGAPVHSVHHGLHGEAPLSFTASLRPAAADLIFSCGNSLTLPEMQALLDKFPDLKIIVLESLQGASEDDSSVFALPEINRKALVRGARLAEIPSAVASLALVPLYPLARHMLLSENIELTISAPEDLVTTDKLKLAEKEISSQLALAQRSFNGKISFKILSPSSKRGIELQSEISTPLDLEHILETYNLYDDHNFSFPITSPVKLEDVKGTEKIIFSLSLSKEGKLNLHAVADGRLRGSAGEAVHVMNLMFGLHEKTGLYLKPYAF